MKSVSWMTCITENRGIGMQKSMGEVQEAFQYERGGEVAEAWFSVL